MTQAYDIGYQDGMKDEPGQAGSVSYIEGYMDALKTRLATVSGVRPVADNYLVINLCPFWDDDDKQEFFGQFPTLEDAQKRVMELFEQNETCDILHIHDNRAVEVIAWRRPGGEGEWRWITTPILK